MKWIAKTKDGVLEFNSIKVCTESQFNKLGASINRQRIIAWCDDNHISFEIQRGEQCMSIIREVVQEINEAEARHIDILHDKFLEFVDTLPEIDTVEEKKKLQEQDVVNFLTIAKDVINGINEGAIDGAVLITQVGPINLPCGNISPSMLKELFELYVSKYEHKEN